MHLYVTSVRACVCVLGTHGGSEAKGSLDSLQYYQLIHPYKHLFLRTRSKKVTLLNKRN